MEYYTLRCLVLSRVVKRNLPAISTFLSTLLRTWLVGLFEYVGIEQYLTELLASRVDVANRSSLKAFVRPSAERDAVYAF